MMTPTLKHLILGIAMLATAGLAVAMKPTEKIADKSPRIDLEAMIPKQFGDWKVDEELVPLTVNPELQAKLDKIYNQTLSRTYINAKGERIMLSLAYGGDQSDSMQLHRPEACYPAQGFEILKKLRGELTLAGRLVPIKRMVTLQGNRQEPLTYWAVIGDTATRGDTDRKLARIKLGLTGKVPDGMLVRVSSIDREVQHAFTQQDRFLGDLAEALDVEGKKRLLGGGA
jgi:EpsI family protein